MSAALDRPMGDGATFAGGLATNPQVRRRKLVAGLVKTLFIAATASAGFVLLVLMVRIFSQGWDALDWNLLRENISQTENRIADHRAGFYNGIASTLWVVLIAALFAVPVGIGAALYLEEYAPSNWFTKIVQVNIANLAGVPSVVYGLLGLGVLVN